MKKSCKRGYKRVGDSCRKIGKKLTLKKMKDRKKFWSFIGGISGLLVGGFMIFYYKDNLGFIPAILGASLLIFRRNG